MSSRSATNFSTGMDISSHIVWTCRLGWYLLLAKKEDIPVVEDGLLLYVNSTRGSSLTQSDC